MERIAQPVPKPCYAVEFDLSSPICQECEFQQQCFDALGARKHKITLNKVEFKLVPKSYGLDNVTVEDPELPTIERTYLVCHQTIFGRRPKDRISQHKNLLLRNVKLAGCSIRLFMLANMIGFKQQQKQIAENTDRSVKHYYSAVLFTHANSIERVNMYREMCRKEFGTFDLSALDTLTEGGYAENDVERRLSMSEITAAKFLVGFKLRNGGPPWKYLYDSLEFQLDPYWLATEPSYRDTVLKAYLGGERGSKAINNHRYSVTQIIAQMKKKKDWAIAIFQARERIMPRSVSEVLHHFGFHEEDFEIDQEPITSTTDFWVFVARAMQHIHCIRYLEGDRSVFKR